MDGLGTSARLVMENGEVKEIPARRGWGGDSAFVDWVNFSFGEEALMVDSSCPITEKDILAICSSRLHDVLGFGITSKREKGANFYRESWNLGDGWGMVCHGGQRGTVLVALSGEGCAAAKEGWEMRLKKLLERTARARITRLDCAHDDFTGTAYSVNRADTDHTDGLFNCGGRNPDCEYRGNWKRPNGKGRTFQVGNRTNGKYCRVYEKGRQLGDKNSEWVRVEVEFKSTDRIIPFDALIRPGEYLAAAYPAFSWINERQERIYTTQKIVTANVDRAVAWLKHQCGASIKSLVEIFGVEGALSKIIRDGEPSWTKVPNFLLSPPAIHQEIWIPKVANLNASVNAW